MISTEVDPAAAVENALRSKHAHTSYKAVPDSVRRKDPEENWSKP